jgi:hypothetical protein
MSGQASAPGSRARRIEPRDGGMEGDRFLIEIAPGRGVAPPAVISAYLWWTGVYGARASEQDRERATLALRRYRVNRDPISGVRQQRLQVCLSTPVEDAAWQAAWQRSTPVQVDVMETCGWPGQPDAFGYPLCLDVVYIDPDGRVALTPSGGLQVAIEPDEALNGSFSPAGLAARTLVSRLGAPCPGLTPQRVRLPGMIQDLAAGSWRIVCLVDLRGAGGRSPSAARMAAALDCTETAFTDLDAGEQDLTRLFARAPLQCAATAVLGRMIRRRLAAPSDD